MVESPGIIPSAPGPKRAGKRTSDYEERLTLQRTNEQLLRVLAVHEARLDEAETKLKRLSDGVGSPNGPGLIGSGGASSSNLRALLPLQPENLQDGPLSQAVIQPPRVEQQGYHQELTHIKGLLMNERQANEALRTQLARNAHASEMGRFAGAYDKMRFAPTASKRSGSAPTLPRNTVTPATMLARANETAAYSSTGIRGTNGIGMPAAMSETPRSMRRDESRIEESWFDWQRSPGLAGPPRAPVLGSPSAAPVHMTPSPGLASAPSWSPMQPASRSPVPTHSLGNRGYAGKVGHSPPLRNANTSSSSIGEYLTDVNLPMDRPPADALTSKSIELGLFNVSSGGSDRLSDGRPSPRGGVPGGFK